jgi:hypothetical protein
MGAARLQFLPGGQKSAAKWPPNGWLPRTEIRPRLFSQSIFLNALRCPGDALGFSPPLPRKECS